MASQRRRRPVVREPHPLALQVAREIASRYPGTVQLESLPNGQVRVANRPGR